MGFLGSCPCGSCRFDPSGNDRLRPVLRADKGRLLFGKRAAETRRLHDGRKKIILAAFTPGRVRHPRVYCIRARKTWMAGTKPGHDEN
jgi:hypothetical protein